MARRNISELSDIEFRGSLNEAFSEYMEELQNLSARWAFELELAAGDAEAAMSKVHGTWWLLDLDAKVKARRTAKRIKRMQELAHAMGRQGYKFHAEYVKHFLNG